MATHSSSRFACIVLLAVSIEAGAAAQRTFVVSNGVDTT